MITKRSMKKDEQAVSPVIAVIMLIAITVIIAAVVAAFAYGIIGGVKKAPSTALVVEGVKSSEVPVNVTIFHHGGDVISASFNSNAADPWDNLEVRYNGVAVFITDSGNATYGSASAIGVNGNFVPATWPDKNFAPGDQLTIEFYKLKQDDTLIVLHVPSQNILQRITVV